jgi:hypothetical protein
MRGGSFTVKTHQRNRASSAPRSYYGALFRQLRTEKSGEQVEGIFPNYNIPIG